MCSSRLCTKGSLEHSGAIGAVVSLPAVLAAASMWRQTDWRVDSATYETRSALTATNEVIVLAIELIAAFMIRLPLPTPEYPRGIHNFE